MPHDLQKARAALGVQAGATVDEITMAYRRLAMRLHPDREDGNGEQMAHLNAARDALLDPDSLAPTVLRPPREPATYSEYLNLHLHRRAL
jgi:DnaJ domain